MTDGESLASINKLLHGISRKIQNAILTYDSDSGRKALCEWFHEEGGERNLFGGEFLVSDLIIWDGNTHVS